MNKIIPRTLLLLGLLSAQSVLATAQHGGKAEGRRVRFKPGATSAVFTDTVSGSLEIEYELAARAGQELIVRVVSDPPGSAQITVYGPNAKELQMSCLAAKVLESKKLGLPTPSHCYEDTPQLLRREGKTWSSTLPETGNYLLSVVRPDGKPGVSTYSLLLIVPPAQVYSTNQTLPPADVTALETAMRKFIAAFKKPDVNAFLSLFSRSGFFYANNPLNVVRYAVPYSELEGDLIRKGGLYCSYLKRCDELDAFVDHIGDGKMWPRVGGARFVPPGYEDGSLTFVQWRKENGRWVIAEIGYPQA
ncbi:MAG: hypothetical protein AABN95_22715 [Acidobacteriota bacterium]